MPEAVLHTKDPVKVAAGQLGAEKRWTPDKRTTVRIASLSSAQRAVVLALVDAAKKAPTASETGERPGG